MRIGSLIWLQAAVMWQVRAHGVRTSKDILGDAAAGVKL